MAAGLRIWDASGNLVLDVTTRLTRIKDVIMLPGNSSGTIDLSSEPGEPWFFRGAQAIVTAGYAAYPTVNVVGKTIVWSTAGNASSSYLAYGVY